MKHRGAQSEFREERDADLMRAYREVLAESDSISLMETAKAVAASPSRRFWVSEERALVVMGNLERGRTLEGMNSTRREMFSEIYRRYRQYRVQHPAVTPREAVVAIVNSPAPHFYLTVKTVRVLIHKARKEERKRCLQLRKRRLSFMLATRY